MPSKFSWEILIARLALCLCYPAVAATVSVAAPDVTRRDGPIPHRADRILIVPRAGHAGALGRLHAQTRARVAMSFPGMGNVQVLQLPGGGKARDLVERYRRSGLVEVAELDQWIEPAVLPDDPAVQNGDQWHLNNLGMGGGLRDADIDAAEGWNILHSASNVIVAVIDSGVRLTHEDLEANLWVNPGEIPGNGLDDDGNGIVDDVHGLNAVTDTGAPSDDTGHGTHVTGVLGAVGNNGLGVSGVAWNVQIMPCKFLAPAGGSESDLIQCLDYARTNGVQVANCSFVAPSFTVTLSNAFWSLRTAGIVVVAAAGNPGRDNDVQPQYPANFKIDNVVAVTATTRTDGFSGFNRGATTVHLAAPGSSILSTYHRSDSDTYVESGTSMAAPCVAAAAALLSVRFPDWGHAEIIDRILATTDPLPSLAGRCRTGGRLNLGRALGYGELTSRSAPFAWVATNQMTSIGLGDDAVSDAFVLPFVFPLYGKEYTQVYVGANGLIGFTGTGLENGENAQLPGESFSGGVISPFWDDLNPGLGGSIWVGWRGAAPNRALVVSWVDVPHADTGGGETRLTFQAILYESQQIVFQYAEVEGGRYDLAGGRSATIGIGDETWDFAAEYAYEGDPVPLTDGLALLFEPAGTVPSGPTLVGAALLESSDFQLDIYGQPGLPCVLSVSPDRNAWTVLGSDTVPGSGVLRFIDSIGGEGARKFYRAEVVP